MNNEKTCRSCLEDHIPMISLFQYCADVDKNMQLFELINFIAKIQVNKDDDLPEKICEICFNELKRSWKFVTQLQDSDKTLHSIEVLDIPKNESYEEEYLETKFEISDSLSNIVNCSTESVYTDDHNDSCLLNNSKVDIDVIPRINNKLNEENYPKQNEKDCKTPEFTVKVCNLCGEFFKNKSKLRSHVQKEHDFEHKCEHCNKSFPQSLSLKVHMRAHFTDREKPFSCSTCDALFAYEYQLKQHSYKHIDEKPFPCPKCSKGCITADSLKRHLRIHEENYTKTKHVCKICHKGFPYPSFLAEHMKNHTGEKPFLCSQCGRGFRQQGALKYHVRSHQKIRPFKCEVCSNTFVSQGILRVHMRRHTGERPYSCDICGRGFRQSSDCRIHRRTHFGLKLVECSICNKKLSTTGQLTIHMRMHTGERPFSCQQCLKRFSTRTVLKKHLRTHTGEKPYVCNICNKTFAQSSSLNTHLKTHSPAKENSKKQKEILKNPVIIVKA